MRTITKRAAIAALATALLATAGCKTEEDPQTCSDFCGEGAACVGGTCVAVEQCSGGCDAGSVCQGAGAQAQCVPLLESACAGGCEAGQVCLASGGAAACVGVCGAGQAWSAESGTCQATAAYCGPGQSWDATARKCVLANVHQAFLDGPYTKGEDVTADCLACHADVGEQMLGSAHFAWTGDAPRLVNAARQVSTDASGKRNIINDYCVATPSNEGRCSECHAGYGDPAQKKAAYQLAPDAKRVDCLVCHADLATGYVKAQKNFGVADVKAATGCAPACGATQICAIVSGAPACVDYQTRLSEALVAAARSVRKPGRDNCGKCHFYAGGGDNVKMGDLASSLASPASPEVDVHMGTTDGTTPSTCADCHGRHAGETDFSHDALKGTGISVGMVEEAPLACADCHPVTATTPHPNSAKLNGHAEGKIACQTCHIPAFSRQLATKMDWDWSFAGYKDCKYPGAPQAIVDACVLDPASPAFGTSKATIDGVEVDYSWQKGVFVMEKHVKPAYRWYDGTAFHQTITGENAPFDPARGATKDDPIPLSGPVAFRGDPGAKITPFKHMGGRQAVMKDGSFVIVPHVFGNFGFWTFRPDPTDPAKTVPVIPATSTAAPAAAKYGTHASYAAFLESTWNDTLSIGAAVAGQIPALVTAAAGQATRSDANVVTVQAANTLTAGDRVTVVTSDAAFGMGVRTITAADATRFSYQEWAVKAPAAGATVTSTQPLKVHRALLHGADWEWRYTEMFMNTNHEVAPKASALTCVSCHTASGPVCGLYVGLPAAQQPWGCFDEPVAP